VIVLLGKIAMRQGNYALARTLHEESLREAGAFKDHWVTASCLQGLAETMVAQGAAAWAAQLWGTAEVELERCGLPLSLVDQMDYEAAVAAARFQLGETAFATAWAEVRSLTLAQVLARQR
jgi:hypothetical protein